MSLLELGFSCQSWADSPHKNRHKRSEEETKEKKKMCEKESQQWPVNSHGRCYMSGWCMRARTTWGCTRLTSDVVSTLLVPAHHKPAHDQYNLVVVHEKSIILSTYITATLIFYPFIKEPAIIKGDRTFHDVLVPRTSKQFYSSLALDFIVNSLKCRSYDWSLLYHFKGK